MRQPRKPLDVVNVAEKGIRARASRADHIECMRLGSMEVLRRKIGCILRFMKKRPIIQEILILFSDFRQSAISPRVLVFLFFRDVLIEDFPADRQIV